MKGRVVRNLTLWAKFLASFLLRNYELIRKFLDLICGERVWVFIMNTNLFS